MFTAQDALSPYIKQIRFIFKGLMLLSHFLLRQTNSRPMKHFFPVIRCTAYRNFVYFARCQL
jgi:hypothetical protein